jgi:hypothetical protein
MDKSIKAIIVTLAVVFGSMAFTASAEAAQPEGCPAHSYWKDTATAGGCYVLCSSRSGPRAFPVDTYRRFCSKADVLS